MTFKGKEISKELMEKAEKCRTADELMALAKENDIELTVDEAQAFLDESADIELDEEQIDQAAGGGKPCRKNKCNEFKPICPDYSLW